ncbi:MAG: hypothetical protein P1U74_08445 [Legionellaceae bacterium]|nr:hypothetical protein [Legionellaceae bacterium]
MTQLHSWIKEIEGFIDRNEDIDSHCYTDFIENPDLAIPIIDCINELDEVEVESNPSCYTACVFVLDVCVSQLQSAIENGNKHASKTLNQLMSHMATIINNAEHTLSFWLPILNAFYEVNIELSDELKDAYFVLANDESEVSVGEEQSHLSSIRDLILDLSDLSVFDIAENFFAQSSAMPSDFFIDLILDLYSIEEGREIALLSLLHPKAEVREVVFATMESIISTITLSPISLSRLQMIRLWYPDEYQDQIDGWIKVQRRKGVVFHREKSHASVVQMQASEVDGGGAQGIFIHTRKNRKNRLCGLLLKDHIGIKDAWMTPVISATDVRHYYKEAFDDSLVLRKIDIDYLVMLTNHFLSVMIDKGNMPDIHLLEIQEALGIQFLPEKIDVDDMIQKLGVLISPFTPDVVEESLKRSKKWLKNKKFTESWFIESASIDKLVNRCSSFEEGVKICQLDQAIEVVITENMETQREQWVFHFLWVALWAKLQTRKNEKLWEDSFIIAYSIYSGRELASIPILKEISRQSVINSIKTMQERGTHLSG